jgi:prepilin-type N-terminal cleavage/methylation domain-containing protein
MRTVSSAGTDQRGFTLAELLVTMALMGLVMAGIMPLMVSGNQTYATGSNQIEAQQGARVALERMAREIRGAGFNPTRATCGSVQGGGQGGGQAGGVGVVNCPVLGAGGLANLSANNIRIQSDLNGDGDFIDVNPDEAIEYRLNGTILERQVVTPGSAYVPIIGGIQSLTFTYLDANGVTTTVPSNVRSIQIDVTAQPEKLPAKWETGRVSVRMSDRIRLRNL